jgi:hypothetical protein
MTSIYACVHPFCNRKMLIEDYTSAVLWRISAIFFTIAALFSAAVVVWYLIFRENPNMPDETDSLEKNRFVNEFEKDKHNLLSEIIGAFKNMPSLNASIKVNSKKSLPQQQNFCQRLAYFFCGSFNSSNEQIIDSETDQSTGNFLFFSKYLIQIINCFF